MTELGALIARLGILITGALNVGFGALCEELWGLYDGLGAM